MGSGEQGMSILSMRVKELDVEKFWSPYTQLEESRAYYYNRVFASS